MATVGGSFGREHAVGEAEERDVASLDAWHVEELAGGIEENVVRLAPRGDARHGRD